MVGTNEKLRAKCQRRTSIGSRIILLPGDVLAAGHIGKEDLMNMNNKNAYMICRAKFAVGQPSKTTVKIGQIGVYGLEGGSGRHTCIPSH